MPEPKPRILITGANGFVGAQLCKTFLQHGLRVVAGVRRSSDLSALDGVAVEFRYGDVTSSDTLPAMVQDVDYIIHNAGVVKARHPEVFFQVNEQGTKLLLEATVDHNPKVSKVVYVSSLAAAGPAVEGRPLTEQDPARPVSAYGQSKLRGEQVALSFADRMHVISLRPPGVYGPGDREIFSFFEAANRGLRPCIGDMNRKQQLVHVKDLCRAVYLAVTGTTVSGEAFFVAENRSYSMKELVQLLMQAAGWRGIPVWMPGPVFRLAATVSELAFKAVGATPMLTREKARELLASWEVSTDKARRAFGFESEIAFEQGARETMDWYRKEGWLK